MFHIRHLVNYTQCPTCNSNRIRSVSIDGTHSNGSQFETISFECGHVAKFVPNFMKIMVTSNCRYSQEEKDKNTLCDNITDVIIQKFEETGCRLKHKRNDLLLSVKFHIFDKFEKVR